MSILDGYVYQWLLALVSILSLVAVLTAVHPGASWHRAALSLPPLVAIGRRSYGLYLWSWPIFVILGATHGSVRRVMVALAVTAVVSEACYRSVELPVRHGALGRWWRRSPPRQRLIPLAWATAAVVAIVAFYATRPYNRALGGADASFSLPTSTVATRDDDAGAATPGMVAATTTSAVADGSLPVVVVGDSTGYALVLNAPTESATRSPSPTGRSRDAASMPPARRRAPTRPSTTPSWGVIAGSTSGPMPPPRAGRRSPSWCSGRGTCSTFRTATATT